METPTMTAPEAARKALQWVLEAFPDAENVYRDYQEAEGFTDEEYEAMLVALRRLASQPE